MLFIYLQFNWKVYRRAQWHRGRVSGSRLRGPGFESCGVMLNNLGQVIFTLHCSSSLSCINEYLAIDSGGYVRTAFAH